MITRQKAIAVAAAVALGTSFSMVPAAMAQTAAPKTPAMSPDSAPKKLDEHKLKSFAVAYLQVDKINRQYQSKIAKAGSQAEKQKIQSEASQKMAAAVNDVDDMSVQEYSRIITSAQRNPSLAKQLTDEIQKVAKSGQ
ncbi:MAG TPA: DUF4168 domain-containing protein [Pararhizobium sp.]|nr:DUF4168 domain-containing protein [Pararhizobium sp.]